MSEREYERDDKGQFAGTGEGSGGGTKERLPIGAASNEAYATSRQLFTNGGTARQHHAAKAAHLEVRDRLERAGKMSEARGHEIQAGKHLKAAGKATHEHTKQDKLKLWAQRRSGA